MGGTEPVTISTSFRIGLFFGSFNPIHNGHLGIARYMLAEGLCKAVWFVVSPCNPFKQDRELLPEQQRLEMVQRAIAGEPGMRACDVEFDMPKPSYTYLSLQRLSESYPGEQFALIMGGDNLRGFHQWRNYETIQEHYPILVYPRPGYDTSTIYYPNVIRTEAPLFPISSTAIRQMVARGEDVSSLVPRAVLPLVEQALKRG